MFFKFFLFKKKKLHTTRQTTALKWWFHHKVNRKLIIKHTWREKYSRKEWNADNTKITKTKKNLLVWKKQHEEWTFLHWKCVARGCKFCFDEFLFFAWNSFSFPSWFLFLVAQGWQHCTYIKTGQGVLVFPRCTNTYEGSPPWYSVGFNRSRKMRETGHWSLSKNWLKVMKCWRCDQSKTNWQLCDESCECEVPSVLPCTWRRRKKRGEFVLILNRWLKGLECSEHWNWSPRLGRAGVMLDNIGALWALAWLMWAG